MSMPSTKEEVNGNRRLDFISQLPDDILSSIISSLSIDDAVRTSVLSKRWMHLRNNVFHFDFDWTHMLAAEELARKYSEIVNTILQQHIGDYLTSCCFKHRRNVSFEDLKTFVEFVVERKKLSSLSLECDYLIMIGNIFRPKIFLNLCSLELTNYRLIDSVLPAFESCEKLKILKLKKISMEDSIINGILENCFGLEKFSLIESYGFDSLKIENKNLKYLELLFLNVKEIDVNVEELHVLVIHSLSCPPNGLRIYSQNLWNFSCNLITQEIEEQNILQTREVFESSSNLLVENASVSPATSDNCALPFPKLMFWEKREVSNFIFNKLKFVTMKGFTGKELEVSFAKHLITKACMMKRLYVICNSTIVEEAKDLLSLRRASTNLSIRLKSKI